tara:strand:- start:51 stop:485 length:435 start_codon:yes stop_codon:yes gene_type:complete
MKKIFLKASCLCGGIKFKTKGYHRNIYNCHCVQCVKTHGHHAAYTCVKEKNIKFIKKRTLKWFKSSKKGKRGFCKKCGASIFYKITAKRVGNEDLHISAGMFKKPLKLKTIANIYTKSKLDYYKLDKSIPKFKRDPKTYYPSLK